MLVLIVTSIWLQCLQIKQLSIETHLIQSTFVEVIRLTHTLSNCLYKRTKIRFKNYGVE